MQFIYDYCYVSYLNWLDIFPIFVNSLSSLAIEYYTNPFFFVQSKTRQNKQISRFIWNCTTKYWLVFIDFVKVFQLEGVMILLETQKRLSHSNKRVLNQNFIFRIKSEPNDEIERPDEVFPSDLISSNSSAPRTPNVPLCCAAMLCGFSNQ